MKKSERKEKLLQIAYELFLKRGYEAVSVDDIIAEAGIAKGTYYYYFKSKEETLEEVIDRMIEKEEAKARMLLEMPIPIPQKIVGIMSSFRPDEKEQDIVNTLNQKKNVVMHDKVNNKIIERAVPLLTKVVEEGNREGIVHCDYVEERIRMLLILSIQLFDGNMAGEGSVKVFIDVAEKILGVSKGTLQFIEELIAM